MKKSKYTEEQIAFALKQTEVGTPVEEVCRKMGISDATLNVLAQKCPNAYGVLHDNAIAVRYPVKEYLQEKHGNVAGFLQWWRSHLQSLLSIKSTVALFRDARALPENPDILVRYQSGLDNELYKAMRALREAQQWRLSTLGEVKDSAPE